MASTLWVLLLGATLLTTGCVTLAPQPGGSTSGYPPTMTALRETAAGTLPLEAPSSLSSTEPGEQKRLYRRQSARGLGSDVAPPSCGGVTVPPGWPDFSSGDREALFAPFRTCTSPAEFLALQERVDMPRLVEALDDWRAVRLGAQGTLREDAARLLNRKRTSLLVDASEHYGAIRAGVLALYIVDSAHDDDLREILFFLAQDKRLEETLELLPAFQTALEKRGLKPTARRDRDFEVRDVGRGLARAGRDALSSAPMSGDAAAFAFSTLQDQLPPSYQKALHEAEMRWAEQHFSPGNVLLGSFDHLTFGVPLGFYGLLASTGHGAYSLTQGKYEQATRELAPAALLVALYAGGKGMRYLSEARGAPGMGLHLLTGLEAMELRLRALKETARQLEGLLGVEGLRELARYLQASREAGRFVAVGGADAALALYEARGDVAKARPLMSRARPGTAGSSHVRSGARTGAGQAAAVADETARLTPKEVRGAERPGSLASLVDEKAGLTPEVVEARLSVVELESTGPRLPKDVGVLEKQRPSLDAPPPEAWDNPRWLEYVDYYEKRLGEVKEGKAAKGPLPWDAYEQMRGWFARGLAFERAMMELLEADAQLPRAQRRFLGDFVEPRIETNVGIWKPGTGLRFADVLIIEEGELAGRPRRVETFSFKSRDLSELGETALTAQMIADAREALQKYGGTLDIRRDALQPLLRGGNEVPVQRVRLVYEGDALKPKISGDLDAAVGKTQKEVPGVEVLFQ
ncbi:hypothetical protein [Vitiosangium sp. GDMCC 1.1324]|uniref:hypothetical protein n=1 Tax=Vitiosangium sp. (strain GDMCC 1.1324) TaxID=2138576 RepID=UPI000D3B20AF|nr:hypothetical protein [Vitiosangium sp. GDMCC 1.1324]PTL77860.1 hypothetical protein DAT35_42435 [Vitiosangium sp. GDMCC 1.1324]